MRRYKIKCMDLKEKLIFFLKGICMGLADIVPGVSGGTIALITGIYERLIEAIESVDPRDLKSVDVSFLAPLASGIILAFLVASKVILFFLHTFESYVFAFFFGLILASAAVVHRRTSRVDSKTVAFGVLGFVVSFYVIGLEYLSLIHTPPMIFFSGFLAICAMLLPGVSGSFILLFLGQYEYMLNALQSFGAYWEELLIFISGAVFSLFTFSRIIGWFLEKDEATTLSFLVGLMVGALRLPLSRITVALTPINLVAVLMSGGVGLVLVTWLER